MNNDLISRKAALRIAVALSEFDEGGWETKVGAVKVDNLNALPAVDAVEVVRCRECVHRGSSVECPMCFEETYYDEDDGSDWYTVDRTTDEGFCHCGETDLEE